MNDEKLGSKIVPHLSTKDWCLFSFDNQILKYYYNEDKFVKITYISSKSGGLKGFLKENVLRNYFYKRYVSNKFGINHISANNEFVIAFYGGLHFHRLQDDYAKARRLTKFDELKASGPLFQGIAVHEKSQNFYFGEYVCGRKGVIRIVKISHDLKEVKIVYSFKENPVHHVHGIFYDRYLDRLWITTGDRDDECGIYFTDDEFETMQKLGGGDQSWRAVSVVPMRDKLIWGSDAGKDANAEDLNMIYSYNYKTKEKKAEVCIRNPAYHAIVDQRNNVFIGVNFEPGRKQDTEEEVAIWMYDGAEWKKIRRYKYKAGSVQGCSKYGYVYFPKGGAPFGKVPFLVLNCDDMEYTTYTLNSV